MNSSETRTVEPLSPKKDINHYVYVYELKPENKIKTFQITIHFFINNYYFINIFQQKERNRKNLMNI